MNRAFTVAVVSVVCLMLGSSVFPADQQNLSVLYPRDLSIVGNRVNVVLDPTDIPFFQVTVNTKSYPIIDTSRGMHAYQGVPLETGENRITITVLAPDEKNRKKLSMIASRTLTVFNRDGAFSPPPSQFANEPFHTREHESTCAGCHRLEVAERDVRHEKPEEVLCYGCHREVPTGKHIHGPAAVWNCLSCHDPQLYPAKYAFTSLDPWKAQKTTQPAEPMVFSLPADGLFKPVSSALKSKTGALEALSPVLKYIGENPGDKVRVEVHSDNSAVKQQKGKRGKIQGYKDNQALTTARARSLAAVLTGAGVRQKRLTVAGMGNKLPRVPNTAPDSREINNRVDIVVYPPGVKVTNSRKLPVLKDRERVAVHLSYSQGPPIKKLRVIERLPKGVEYVRGSGFANGRTTEPKIKGSELLWELSDVDTSSNHNLFYVIKKGKGAAPVSDSIKIQYLTYGQEQSREFDARAPMKTALTVTQVCLKCHEGILSKPYKHGPVDAGYCNLCHDPHASPNAAWLRKPAWDLCTTCHSEHGSGVHVVAGFVKGNSHPTRNRRDPARPGKKLSCSSCHQPHSAESPYLFSYDVKTRNELCALCHKK